MELNQKERTTDFYKIIIDMPRQIDITSINHDEVLFKNNCLNTLKSHISDIVNSDDSTKEFGDNFIEFIDSDDNFAFGIIGKSSNVGRGIMKRIKNTSGQEVLETDYLEENFKYFVIKYDGLEISIIRNNKAPQIRELMSEFISSTLSSNMINAFVYVNPLIDKDAIGKVNQMTTLSKINVRFSSDSNLAQQALSLNTILGYNNENIVGGTVELTFKNQKMTDKAKKFIKDEGNMSNFARFEVTGGEDLGEQTVELVNKYLIKKVALDLTDEELTDANKYINKIKQTLISSF